MEGLDSCWCIQCWTGWPWPPGPAQVSQLVHPDMFCTSLATCWLAKAMVETEKRTARVNRVFCKIYSLRKLEDALLNHKRVLEGQCTGASTLAQLGIRLSCAIRANF